MATPWPMASFSLAEKTGTIPLTGASPARVARLGGRGSQGGALWRIGGASGGRKWRDDAAAGARVSAHVEIGTEGRKKRRWDSPAAAVKVLVGDGKRRRES
jgi:hypothetical protein